MKFKIILFISGHLMDILATNISKYVLMSKQNKLLFDCYSNIASNQITFTITNQAELWYFNEISCFRTENYQDLCEWAKNERLHALDKLYILYQGSQQTCGTVTTAHLHQLHHEPEDPELQQVRAELAQQLRSARPASREPGEEGAEVHLQHSDLQVGVRVTVSAWSVVPHSSISSQ